MASSEMPVRDFMDDPNTQWKTMKPDYTLVNELYLQEKSRNHKSESLEKVVENLVKTWEMESSHKINEKDWQSVEKEEFVININGVKRFGLQDNIEIGNYNMLLATSPLYDSSAETNDSSHDLFRTALPGGFAWELLELYSESVLAVSGPPTVTFKWRHWGRWEGQYKGHEPTGEVLEMFGTCVVTVTPQLKIKTLEVYYDPNQMLATMLDFDRKNLCPAHKK